MERETHTHIELFSMHIKKPEETARWNLNRSSLRPSRVRFRSVLEQVTPERALRDSIYPIGSLMIGNERRDRGAERKVWNI